MKHERLHALTDGIFAIAMTLLVLDLKIPEVGEHLSVSGLWMELFKLWPVFFSFTLSFMLLSGYWRAQNLVIGGYVKNLDLKLVNLNLIFLFFVSLVPFSTNLLGRFIGNRAGIIVYGLNVSLLGLTMHFSRRYADRADHLDTSENGWTRRDRRNSTIRAYFPIVTSLAASLVSVRWGAVALVMLVVAILINMTRTGFDPLYSLLDTLHIGIDE